MILYSCTWSNISWTTNRTWRVVLMINIKEPSLATQFLCSVGLILSLQSRAGQTKATPRRSLLPPAPFHSGGRSSAGEEGGLGNHRADLYRVVRFLSTPRFSSSAAEVVFPGAAAAMLRLLRRIKFFSGWEDGSTVFSGEVWRRFVCLLEKLVV